MTNPRVIAVAILIAGMVTHLPAGRGQDAKSVFQVVQAPNPQGFGGNDLFAAGASSPNDIWAVGLSAIHFNGTAWTGFPLPGIHGAIGSELKGVATISPTNAWAVGTFRTSQTTTGNLQHWDGSKWSVSSSSTLADGEPLFSIAALSADDIWVGGCIPAFFEHFDGTEWTFVTAGGVGSPDGESCVQGISARSTNDVWAVGWIDYSNNSTTQIQHWDGTQWTVTPSPNVGTGSNQLFGAVALADNDVWAVGSSIAQPDTGIEYPNQTLIEHWDGAAWTVVPSPNINYGGQARDNILQGVVAVSPNDLWAFGSVDSNPGTESDYLLITLILHWDGASWTVAPSPNPDRDPNLVVNQLFGGVVTGPGSVWIVGSQEVAPGRGNGTLVLHN